MIKNVLLAAVVATASVTLGGATVSAATCSTKATSRFQTMTRTQTWTRTLAGQVVGSGSSTSTTKLHYLDCGDTHTKVAPSYATVCLTALDVTNDPYYTSANSVIYAQDETADYNIWRYSYLQPLSLGNCTVVNLMQQYTSGGAMFYYNVSNTPKWSGTAQANDDDVPGVLTAFSTVSMKNFTPAVDPLSPLF